MYFSFQNLQRLRIFNKMNPIFATVYTRRIFTMQESTLFILNKENSIANHFLAEIRTEGVQQDSMRFRRNMERIGEMLAYELSKTLPYQQQHIRTPLADTQATLLKDFPVLISIMRAGIPLHMGLLNIFDHADSGFIGAYREHDSETSFDIAFQYFTAPDLNDKHIMLIDPMLASGKTFIMAIENILKKGTPVMFHLVAAIAAPEGIAYLRQHCPVPYALWLGALDEKLNHQSYIVPGLGDAGDLAFGPKL